MQTTEIIGKKIIGMRRLTQVELKCLAWRHPCVALVLGGGIIVYPSSDEEGNDSGCLCAKDAQGEISQFG